MGSRQIGFYSLTVPVPILQTHHSGVCFTASPAARLFYSLTGGAPVLQPHRRLVCFTASPPRACFTASPPRACFTASPPRACIAASPAREDRFHPSAWPGPFGRDRLFARLRL